jgi:hypothetical protein
MSKTSTISTKTRAEALTAAKAAPTPFSATGQVRVLKSGMMDPGKAIRKLRDK